MNETQRAAVNKRLTLNLLIQGAAAHTFLTAHHLVRDQLEATKPGLVALYDRVVISFDLNAWIGDLPLILGRPGRFWRTIDAPDHPFHHHGLLRAWGEDLAYSSRRLVVARAREKRVWTTPGLHYPQMLRLAMQAIRTERPHREALAAIAIQATSQIWGIESDRLRAKLTTEIEGFTSPPANSTAGRMMRCAVAGYSQVEREGDRFAVRAVAVTWILLLHELVKGVAELVCLHGTAKMEDDLYAAAIEGADVLEQEHWLMQAGAEAWRRLLAVAPKDRTLAECLMQVATLTPERLSAVMHAVCASSPSAPSLLAELRSE